MTSLESASRMFISILLSSRREWDKNREDEVFDFPSRLYFSVWAETVSPQTVSLPPPHS